MENIKMSELQARFASLLDCGFGDIELMSGDQSCCRWDGVRKKYVIEFTNIEELVHEFAHVAYTNFDQKRYSGSINALEDYRIERLLEKHDKRMGIVVSNYRSKIIAGSVKNIRESKLAKEDLHDALVEMSCTCDDGNFRAVSAELSERERKIIENEHKKMKKELTTAQVLESHDVISKLFLGVKKGALNGLKVETFNHRSQRVKEQQKVYEPIGGERVSPEQHLMFVEVMKRIVKAKCLGRRESKTGGKLNSKRLGLYPNEYVFTKKTRPSPDTSLYVLADLSGSMVHNGKLEVLSAILEELRLLKIPGLQVNVRGFNLAYWCFSEIGHTVAEIVDINMNSHRGGGILMEFSTMMLIFWRKFCGRWIAIEHQTKNS